jgi:benzil reductase ((S)-benzoin forming)
VDRVLYIITGSNRGIGKAIIDLILPTPNAEIIAVGRTANDEHLKYVKAQPSRLHFIEADLAKPDCLPKMLLKFDLHMAAADCIVFINNAGTISPIERIGRLDLQDLTVSLGVNCVSPALIVNHIIKESFNKRLILANITSGAAIRAIDGWVAYCSSKAYMKMFFSVLTEQVKNDPRIQVFQIDPGMVDTDMQQNIRRSDPEIFPSRTDFIDAKDKGILKTPEQAAVKILNEIGLL